MPLVKSPPEDLAAKLVDASERILAPDREVKLEEVARTVGVARATLYYYFSGRDDLVGYLLTHHLKAGGEVLMSELEATSDPATRLERALGAMVSFLAARPGVCAGLLGAAAAGGRLTDVLAANDRAIGAPLRELLTEGRTSGAFAFDDAKDAANALLGGAVIAVVARAGEGRPLDRAFATALTDQLVRSVIADVGSNPPDTR